MQDSDASTAALLIGGENDARRIIKRKDAAKLVECLVNINDETCLNSHPDECECCLAGSSIFDEIHEALAEWNKKRGGK